MVAGDLLPWMYRLRRRVLCVADDHRWAATQRHDPVELAPDAQPRQRGVRHQRQAFAREVVHHGEDAKPPPAAQRIRDEVQRSALVRPLRQHHRRPGAQCPLPAAAAAHAEAFRAVEPQQLLVVWREALAGQHIAQTPIAELPPLGRQFSQPLPQASIVRPARLIPCHPPGNADQITPPTLAQPVTLPGMGDRVPFRAGHHHFLSRCH